MINDKPSEFPSSVKIHALMGEDYHLLRIAKAMESMIKENGMSA
jgi:Asp-tRNA(Asn)/Glu-tRNA(Gln) amidotransferase A subunit family amidase